MFHGMLQWTAFHKIVLNTLFVSIPEELFVVMFTLILIGEFDYWKEDECKKLIHHWDYGRILIPTVVAAALSNIFRYTFVDIYVSSTVTILATFVLIVLTNDIFGDASAMKWTGKAFIFLLLACIIVGVTEFMYIPLIVYSTGKSMMEINNNVFVNFLVALPSKIILYSLLAYLICKKRTLLQGKVLKHILESPLVLSIFMIVIFCNLIFYILAYKVVVYQKALLDEAHLLQVALIVGIILFPILNISALVWSLYYMKNRETVGRKCAYDKLYHLIADIEEYGGDKNQNDLKWKLREISMGIEEVAGMLYREPDRKKS